MRPTPGRGRCGCGLSTLAVVSNKRMSPLLRLLYIVLNLLHFGAGLQLARLGLSRSDAQPPERLCLLLARLGTTFIKFGQALSMRSDILTEDYVAALRSLQDHATPFPADLAIREIERGLRRPIRELFARFDEVPLAAASIAQVHSAELPDGRPVVVKIRRIGIERQIDRDMRALRLVTRIATALMPRLAHYRPLRIIDEIWSNLRKEIDFHQEARNIKRFATAFADWPAVDIPRPIDGLVGETVLVQERSGGCRIDDPAIRAEGPRIAQHFVDLYLHQIFVLGVFHGDPHPGNVFVTTQGRICFHDFGLVGILDRAARRRLAAFTSAFVHQDSDWLLDAAIELGILGGALNRAEFRRGLSEIMADFAARPLKEWSMAEAFVRVTRLNQTQNVFVPYDLLLLMRAIANAEHVVRVLDPEFRLLENLQAKGPAMLEAAIAPAEWTATIDRLRHDALAAMQDLPATLGAWARRLGRDGDGIGLSLRLRGLHSLEAHLDRSSNRIALALVTLGLYIAGSLLMQHSIGPRLYEDMPALAALAFVLALWFTFRLARAITRSGRL